MSQEFKEKESTVYYNRQSIPKSLFRVFVYDKSGNSRLTENWQEFKTLTSSGEYFEFKPSLEAKETKKTKAKE